MIARSMTWPRRRCDHVLGSAAVIANAQASGADAVGQAERRQRGRSVRFAGDRGEATHRLGQRAEPRPVRVRPELAERRDARDHQPRIAFEQRRADRKVPALQRPGPEVLDQDVGAADQVEEHVPRERCREVERDRPLVAADRLPPQSDAVLALAVAARRVGSVGCSILTTSAPRSARWVAASGPANSVAASTTSYAGERAGHASSSCSSRS